MIIIFKIILSLIKAFSLLFICAFVGTIDEDENALPITGNGKTASMVGYSWLDHMQGKEVWSNFQTDFSTKVIGFQEMVDTVIYDAEHDIQNPNLILCVTEMRKILDAVGSTTEQMLYIDNFDEQIRKIGCTLYYDTQRFYSIHKRLRIHTNVVLIPYKTHFDERACYLPKCMKPHKIYVYSHKPENPTDINGNLIPRKIFNMGVIAKHYESEEFCRDKLRLPKRVKGEIL